MKINAKIINTRFSSWTDKKTNTIRIYLIVSVKTINGDRYAVNAYGRNSVLLSRKEGALISLDIKNIKDFKSHKKAALNTVEYIKINKVLIYKAANNRVGPVVTAQAYKMKPRVQPKSDNQTSPLTMILVGLLSLLF